MCRLHFASLSYVIPTFMRTTRVNVKQMGESLFQLIITEHKPDIQQRKSNIQPFKSIETTLRNTGNQVLHCLTKCHSLALRLLQKMSLVATSTCTFQLMTSDSFR